MLNQISIPYHLVIPSIISIIGFIVILIFRKKIINRNKALWYSLASFFIFYLFIVGIATFYSIYYQWNLNNFDLDHDGFFSGSEINKNQQLAMKRLINDTGRNFSFITGLVVSGILSFFTYLLFNLLKAKKKKSKATFAALL